MAVYVDYPLEWGYGSVKEAPRVKKWCHLFADSLKELNAFAFDIEMKSQWFQISKSGIPHYDLSESRRKMAVRAGAKEITPTLDDLKRWKSLLE